MPNQVSRSQERLAMLIGGSTLVAFSVFKKRPAWGGLVLAGMGALLLTDGVEWLQDRSPDFSRRHRRIEDEVDEGSDESFPASDPPAWTHGTR